MGTSTVTPPPGYALDKAPLDLSAGFVPKQKAAKSQDNSTQMTHPLGDVTGIDHDSGLPIVKRGKPKIDNGAPDVQPKVDDAAAAAGEKTAKEPALKPEIADATNKRQPIGKTDPESDRKITQPSDNPAANQALATAAMPEFRKGIETAIKGIKGAELAASRPAKNPKRLAEKINGEDQPAETVSDYGAAQVSVDSPQVKDEVVAAIKKQFPIVKEDDAFEKGDKDYGYRAHTLQVQMPNKASMELQIVPKEVHDANADEHGDYKAAREADLNGKDAGPMKAAAKAKNDAAMAKFNERNSAKPSAGGKLAKGSSVTLPDGSSGTISYLDPGMRIARVKTAAGKSVTVKQAELKPAAEKAVPEGHVLVKEHARKLPVKKLEPAGH